MPLFRKDHSKKEQQQPQQPPEPVTSTKKSPKVLPDVHFQRDDSDYSLYKTLSNTSVSDMTHSFNRPRSRSSSMSQKFKSLFAPHSSSTDLSNSNSPHSHEASPSPSPSSNVSLSRGSSLRHSSESKHIQQYPVPNRQTAVKRSEKSKEKAIQAIALHKTSPHAGPTSPVLSIDSPSLSSSVSPSFASLSPTNKQGITTPAELAESVNKLKFMPPVIENDLDEVLEEMESGSSSDNKPLRNNTNKQTSSIHLPHMHLTSSGSSRTRATSKSSSTQRSDYSNSVRLPINGGSANPRGRSEESRTFSSTSSQRSESAGSSSNYHRQRSSSVSVANPDGQASAGHNKSSPTLQGLKHSQSVNYSSLTKDHVLKLKNGRIKIYGEGDGVTHEHDFSKFKTQPTKVGKSTGWFGWAKKKDAEDDKVETISKSVSLLPDSYSLQLMELKADPENYRWNYDDSDSDSDDSDSEKDSEDEDDDSEDDQDFDDEADNELIEPIIGRDQINLIKVMIDKIEHADRYKEKAAKLGTTKLPLDVKYGNIEGVVGRGSYGLVSIAVKSDPVDKKKKSFFAIKQLKQRQGEALHHFGNRVVSEFMISSSLTHQAVINVYDLMVDPVTLTYSQVMEYIPCGDLFTLISATNGLEVIECDCFFKQILNAVTYLHAVGISHNDLKVENLLLTKKGQLKITDFGTSAVFRTKWEDKVQFSKGACGSERYVSPEQFQSDKPYDPRLADVWSIGIIYLVMLNGNYVWELAKSSDEQYHHFLDTRARYDYSERSTSNTKEFKKIKRGAFNQIESISGGQFPNSRRYILYNILNPDPHFRMRTYQIWQSDWIKSINVCEAGRGFLSSEDYIEMALQCHPQQQPPGSSPLTGSSNGGGSARGMSPLPVPSSTNVQGLASMVSSPSHTNAQINSSNASTLVETSKNKSDGSIHTIEGNSKNGVLGHLHRSKSPSRR